jgi:hypothetical protein
MTDDTSRPPNDLEGDPAEKLTIPADLPVLPLRDTVLFPNSFMPLAVPIG